jgi:hypothetical protein
VLKLGSIRGILVDVYLRLEDNVLNSDVTGNKKVSAIGDAASWKSSNMGGLKVN